jgi:hypothetical protein
MWLSEEKRKARRIFEQLVARIIPGFGYEWDMIQYYRRNNKPFPDRCMPGRLILKLSNEEREALKYLTADMT